MWRKDKYADGPHLGRRLALGDDVPSSGEAATRRPVCERIEMPGV
jgi:hypothetical protein